MMNAEPTDGTGHRERLRKRLIEGGSDALLDHELIEFLLMLAIPRVDTKPTAKHLLNTFGSIGGLLTADAETIMRNGGISDKATAALKIVQAAALRMLRDQVAQQPVLASWQALLDYLRADLAHLTIERFRILHLNSKNQLIRDEVMSEGSVDQTPVYTREVIRRAIDLGSTSLILVHNHPSGDCQPSRADIAITKEIVDVGRRLQISVHDHVIIGANGHSSMRAMGLM